MIDAAIATIWGRMTARVGVIDGLIAATALHHGYAVVTRNVADFESTGVAVLDVWRG